MKNEKLEKANNNLKADVEKIKAYLPACLPQGSCLGVPPQAGRRSEVGRRAGVFSTKARLEVETKK